jgi:hypothetical protein
MKEIIIGKRKSPPITGGQFYIKIYDFRGGSARRCESLLFYLVIEAIG